MQDISLKQDGQGCTTSRKTNVWASRHIVVVYVLVGRRKEGETERCKTRRKKKEKKGKRKGGEGRREERTGDNRRNEKRKERIVETKTKYELFIYWHAIVFKSY